MHIGNCVSHEPIAFSGESPSTSFLHLLPTLIFFVTPSILCHLQLALVSGFAISLP